MPRNDTVKVWKLDVEPSRWDNEVESLYEAIYWAFSIKWAQTSWITVRLKLSGLQGSCSFLFGNQAGEYYTAKILHCRWKITGNARLIIIFNVCVKPLKYYNTT